MLFLDPPTLALPVLFNRMQHDDLSQRRHTAVNHFEWELCFHWLHVIIWYYKAVDLLFYCCTNLFIEFPCSASYPPEPFQYEKILVKSVLLAPGVGLCTCVCSDQQGFIIFINDWDRAARGVHSEPVYTFNRIFSRDNVKHKNKTWERINTNITLKQSSSTPI